MGMVYTMIRGLNIDLDLPVLRSTRLHMDTQSPNSDYVTRCYINLCPQQGSRDDRVSREVNLFSVCIVRLILYSSVKFYFHNFIF